VPRGRPELPLRTVPPGCDVNLFCLLPRPRLGSRIFRTTPLLTCTFSSLRGTALHRSLSAFVSAVRGPIYFCVADRQRNVYGYAWRLWWDRTSFYAKARSTPLAGIKLSMHGQDDRPCLTARKPGFKVDLDRGAAEVAGCSGRDRAHRTPWHCSQTSSAHDRLSPEPPRSCAHTEPPC
jgi:hypothetical protein